MSLKKVFLLINGTPPKKLPNLSQYDFICATDGAYHYLIEKDVKPHLISGDFDSIKSLPKDVESIYTPNQNYTDFDKMLALLHQKGFLNIDVFGASGKEQDHFFGNIHTAIRWKEKLNIRFFDNYGTYFFAKQTEILHNVLNKTVSLMPLPIAENIVTDGLQYSLKNETLSFEKRIGTRNKAIKNRVTITFGNGNLLLFVNN